MATHSTSRIFVSSSYMGLVLPVFRPVPHSHSLPPRQTTQHTPLTSPSMLRTRQPGWLPSSLTRSAATGKHTCTFYGVSQTSVHGAGLSKVGPATHPAAKAKVGPVPSYTCGRTWRASNLRRAKTPPMYVVSLLCFLFSFTHSGYYFSSSSFFLSSLYFFNSFFISFSFSSSFSSKMESR